MALLLLIVMASFSRDGEAQQARSEKSDAEKIGEALDKIQQLFQSAFPSSQETGMGKSGAQTLEKKTMEKVEKDPGSKQDMQTKQVGIMKDLTRFAYREAMEIIETLRASLKDYQVKDIKMSVAISPSVDVTFTSKAKDAP